MPEPPPVMRIVLPVVFIILLLLRGCVGVEGRELSGPLSTETKLCLGKLGCGIVDAFGCLRGNETAIDSRARGASAYDRWLRSFLYPMGRLEFEVLCYRQ